EVVTYFDPDAPRTMADPHAMEQVFLNLLNNAIQAISSDAGSGTITIGVVAVDGRLRVSFTDDGPGIPPDVMPKLFDPFFTTKPPGQGTGLGLSICYGIVHQHGGTVRAESHPRRGATFVVELPLEPVPEEMEAAPPAGDAEPPGHTMLRALAVDDEAAVVELMARALSSFGHEVDVATDGADALRMIHLADYDAIILDFKMPGLSGADVYRALQGMHPELTDRVLFATGDVASPGTREFLNASGARVLYKPFGLDDLRRHMEAFARAKEERMTGDAAPGRRNFRAAPRGAMS
ncbi:MAG: response regulator, partial [Gemmatimonadetes bacterium]|nr:response regulator [Gemmatimonadota bacterium]